MKLFAPKNNGGWSMTDPNSWWGQVGGLQTVAGKFVSEDSALAFAPVCAATRVISETLASLPLNMLEQIDARTTRKATTHPLWRLLRNQPNREQDIVCFFDMQVALQLNWGNAYAEIQRDLSGRIVALWPIHPSRIPLTNITRNETDPFMLDKIVVGQPGEIVYWVKNDDSTVNPVPASDMLHVPGILSRNGITGQSVVRMGANSIGIGMATEEHAGALFKNGAVTNMVIKSPKTVGKETADRLRQQWQTSFGGSGNHYKTLLLEEGMEPFPISMDPEATQLILARQFSVTEIARWYRVPPHMVGDLTRATFSNIEQQSLDFILYCMKPWLARWEKALFRQLLTEKEKGQYIFEFDLGELLRGDSAARAAWFQAKFNMGAASPNDVRAADHENPVEGGDTYFVQSNNYMPLDKVGEMADAQIEKMKAPAAAPQTAAAPSDNQSATNAIEKGFELQDKLIRMHLWNMDAKISETLDPLSETVGNVPDLVSREVKDRLQDAIPAAVASLAEKIPDVHAALAPVIEQQQQHSDVLAAMPAEFAKLIAPPMPVVDTKAAEALAVREAEIDRKQAEIDEKQRLERETTDKMLILSLKRSIDNLAVWEWKALEKAIDKPLEWADWRLKFYQRFARQFESDLGEFVADAESCGVSLDVAWGADRYAGDSIRDLKTLDEAASDNFHDRIKECCDHFRKRQWTERSKELAAELVSRGRKQFNERKK